MMFITLMVVYTKVLICWPEGFPAPLFLWQENNSAKMMSGICFLKQFA